MCAFFDDSCVYSCAYVFTCSHANNERAGQLLAGQTETQSQTDILGNPELESFRLLLRSRKPFFFNSQNVNNWSQTNIYLFFFLFVSPIQKLQTFQSLSCPGFSATDGCQSGLPLPFTETSSQPESDFTAVSELELESRQEVAGDDEEEDSSYEELDSDSACSVDSRPGSPMRIMGGKRTLWKGDCGTQRDIFQLGGELDLDQIERN